METNGSKMRRGIQVSATVGVFNVSQRGCLAASIIELSVLLATPLRYQGVTPRAGLVWVHTIPRFFSRRFKELPA